MLFSPTQAFGVPRLEEVVALAGREVLQAMLDGRLPAPPICRTLNMVLTELGDGAAVFEGEPGEALLNPMGLVHGGWALTMVDSAAGAAAQTTLPAGAGYVTVETKMNFVRPLLPGIGRVRCAGRVVSNGRKVITAEATLTLADGKLAGHGTSTLLVFGPGR